MAGPTTPVLDDFNRADGGVGANWSTFAGLGGLNVASNQVAGSGASANLQYWNVSQYGPKSEAHLKITAKPGNGQAIAVSLRCKDVSSISTLDGYTLAAIQQSGTDVLRCQRVDNSVATTLGADISQEYAAGDGILLRANGSTLEIEYFNGSAWTQLTTRSDATYQGAGYLMVTVQGTTGRADDFGGGTPIEATDGGSLTESATITVSVDVADTASLNEMSETAAQLTAIDSMTAADTSGLEADITTTDSASAGDSSSVQEEGGAESKTASDAFALAEVADVAAAIDTSDIGTAADVIGVGAWLSGGDTLALSEAVTVAASILGIDTGTFTDSGTVESDTLFITAVDSFALVESALLVVTASGSDGFTISETAVAAGANAPGRATLTMTDAGGFTVVIADAGSSVVAVADAGGLTVTLEPGS
jgi:hypothetical protein